MANLGGNLVLTRYPEQSITIDHAGERLEIDLLRVHRNGRVRLAIRAPASFEIRRSELVMEDDHDPTSKEAEFPCPEYKQAS